MGRSKRKRVTPLQEASVLGVQDEDQVVFKGSSKDRNVPQLVESGQSAPGVILQSGERPESGAVIFKGSISGHQAGQEFSDVIIQGADADEQAPEDPASNATGDVRADFDLKEYIQSALSDALKEQRAILAEAEKRTAEERAEKERLANELKQAQEAAQQAQEAAQQERATLLADSLAVQAERDQANKALEGLGKLTGENMEQQSGQALQVLGDGSPEYRRFEKLLNSSESRRVQYQNNHYFHRDKRGAIAYLSQNIDAVRGGVEAILRNLGMFGGGDITNAPTLIADIPSTVFDYLSAIVMRPSDADLVYRQFLRMYPVPGTAPRSQGQIPRYPHLARPTTPADRELTPGTAIVDDRQNLSETLVPVTIKELGLGKNTANAAVGITRFAEAFSMYNLENLMQEKLGIDYDHTIDLYARSVLGTANTVVYNNSNTLVSTPAEVLANGIGHLTRGFLRALFAQMRTDRIPTYSNGYYAFVAPPNQVMKLIDEVAAAQVFNEPSERETEKISRILSVDEPDAYGGEVRGLKLIIDGFMVFEQNVHSVGTSGEGINTETVATVSQLTEECFAFGRDTVCWATALPVEIIESVNDDFRRTRSFIWYSHENAAAMDVNAVGATGQERRVYKCRFTKTAV